MEDILDKYWKENAPNTVLDSSFVDKVIYPAMESYAEQQSICKKKAKATKKRRAKKKK